jgi:hypothetical protein
MGEYSWPLFPYPFDFFPIIKLESLLLANNRAENNSVDLVET